MGAPETQASRLPRLLLHIALQVSHWYGGEGPTGAGCYRSVVRGVVQRSPEHYTGSIHSWAFDPCYGRTNTGGGERKTHYNSQQALGHPSLSAGKVTPQGLMGNVVRFPEAHRQPWGGGIVAKMAQRPKGVVVLQRGVLVGSEGSGGKSSSAETTWIGRRYSSRSRYSGIYRSSQKRSFQFQCQERQDSSVQTNQNTSRGL